MNEDEALSGIRVCEYLTIKRLSEAGLAIVMSQTEVWGFGMIVRSPT